MSTSADILLHPVQRILEDLGIMTSPNDEASLSQIETLISKITQVCQDVRDIKLR